MQPPRSSDSWRSIDEEQMLDELVFHVWPVELRQGPPGEARALAKRALDRWVTLGLPFREVDGARRYDNLEVCNFMKWIGQVGRDDVWMVNNVGTSRRLAGHETRPELPFPEGRYDRTLFEARLTYRIAADAARGRALNLPLPYDDHTQRLVGWTVDRLEGFTADARATEGHLYLRPKQVTGPMLTAEVTVRVESQQCWYDLRGDQLRPPPDDADTALYLRPREPGLVVLTDRVAELARRLVDGAPDRWAALKRIWAYFFTDLKSGWLHHQDLPADDPLGGVLDSRWFDCLAGSSLLVAMARSTGIPARVVGGYILDEVTPTLHYWAEVLLPPYGWIPADLYSWHLAAGRIEDEEWSMHSLARLDHRMKVHRLPRIVSPMPGIELPRDWQVLAKLDPGGARFTYREPTSAAALCVTELQVKRLPAGHGGEALP